VIAFGSKMIVKDDQRVAEPPVILGRCSSCGWDWGR